MEDHLPVLRVFLLGPFRVELVQPDGAMRVIEDFEAVLGRGLSVTLFKLLLIHPERRVKRDLLVRTLWPGHSLVSVRKSLDVTKSKLGRTLEELCGRSLLPRISGDPPIYAIASQEVLWTDLEACEHAHHQALVTRDPVAALTHWEEVYAFMQRGELFAEDTTAYWYKSSLVQDRCTKLTQVRRQCVLRIADLSMECGDINRALAILTAECRVDPAHEDLVFHVMNVLARLERYPEALACYTQLEAALLERGAVPREETRSLALRLRAKGMTKYSSSWSSEVTGGSVSVKPPSQATQAPVSLPYPLISPVENARSPFELPTSLSLSGNLSADHNTPLQLSSPMGMSVASLFRTDLEILAGLSTALSRPSVVHEREITYFDQQTRHYWRAREEAALPTITLYTYVIRHINDITVLLGRSHQPILRSYLCEIACRTVLLAGILLYDMGQYVNARQHYEIALQAASEANNCVLQAIVWGWASFTWTYTKHYIEALCCVQNGRYFALQTMDSVVQTWLGAIESEIQAHLQNYETCLRSLRDMERGMGAPPSQDTSYLFEFNQVLLLGYKGVCLQQMYQQQKPETHIFLQEAKVSLEQALASEAPAKRKLYYLTDLAGVYAREGEIEKACAYVAQSLPLIMAVGSGSKTVRCHLFQVRTLLQPYGQTSFVQTLDQQMGPLLIEMRTEEEQTR